MPFINKNKDLEIQNRQEVTIIPNSNKSLIIPYFEKQEILDILSKIPPNHKGMLFQFLWRTGVRISEAINIRKQDIDFKNNEITIRHLKSRKYQYRVIPLHSSLKQILYLFTAKMLSNDIIFPISRQYAHKLTQKYGLGHPHKIRHSFAINFLRQNRSAMGIIELKDLLGHNHIKSTLVYLRIIPMSIKEAIERVSFD